MTEADFKVREKLQHIYNELHEVKNTVDNFVYGTPNDLLDNEIMDFWDKVQDLTVTACKLYKKHE